MISQLPKYKGVLKKQGSNKLHTMWTCYLLAIDTWH